MAITTLRQVNGDGTGTGTGANVTWPTSGNSSYAVSGLYYTTAEGTGACNMTTASDRGTFYAWGAQGDGDSQPAWATGPSYIEIPASTVAANGGSELLELMKQTDISSLTGAQMEAGIDVTFGIQFAVSGTYAAGTVPQNNNTAIPFSIGDNTAQSYSMRLQSRNVAGFRPGIMLTHNGAYTGTHNMASCVNGSLSTDPMVFLSYNKWYLYRVRWERSTSGVANDGSVRVWINGQMVYWLSGADAYYNNILNLCNVISIGGGYTTAITGCKIRYCPPIKVRSVPDADCVPEWDWTGNTTDDRDLRRWYPANYCDVSGSSPVSCGAPWTMTGGATLVTLGTTYASGGVNPGRSRFVIAGTAGNGFTLTSPSIWSAGGSTDSPKGADGWVHYSFTDLYCPSSGGNIVCTIKDGAGNTIHYFTIDVDAATFAVDGVTKQSSLAATTRWQVIVSLYPGQTIFWLHDLTATTKSATTIRKYSVTNTWAGTSLGTTTIAGTYTGSVSMNVGSLGVFARLRFIECDSYVSANVNSLSPALQCAANNLGKFWNQGCDATVPNGWEPCPTTGGISGVEIALNLARSGYKLSESETYFWSVLSGACPVHGVLIGGVVNDVTVGNTTASAVWSDADTLADRIVRFASLCVNTGGTAIIADTLNLTSGTQTGAWSTMAMRAPNMVATVLPYKLMAEGYPRGKVIYANCAGMLEQNTDYQSSDGVHPATSTQSTLAVNIHHAAKAAQSWDGFNSDGSVRGTSPELGGMIRGMIGG